MNIIFKPEEKHLQQIKDWLHREMLEKKSHFYYNFIGASFHNENFICFVEDDIAIGFMQYCRGERSTEISIAVVQFENQKKGIGRQLMDALSKKVRQQGSVALSLKCAPASSASRWKKLGFNVFREIENHRSFCSSSSSQPWLYQIIIPNHKTIKKLNLDNYIELWTELEYKVKSEEPAKYRWDVSNPELPIIYPVDRKWKIRYVKEGIVLYEGSIKYFKWNAYPDGDFLVIEALP